MDPASIEPNVGRWRAHERARGGTDVDVASLEARLRDHVAALGSSGLTPDEALVVALRRLAESDPATGAFLAEHSVELLAPPAPASGPEPVRTPATELWVVLALAVGAALAFKAPALFGVEFGAAGEAFYSKNLSVLILPFLAAYFIFKHGLSRRGIATLAGVFAGGAVLANAYPFAPSGSTAVLLAIHLPIALWLAAGIAFASGEWRSSAKRMDYVRFTGEWVVTYALIALGGGVLVGIATGVFAGIGLDIGRFVSAWVLPCGAAGAVVVAAWLVETRRFVGAMAPMLARVFTPLFTLMLAVLLIGVVWTRGFVNVDRGVLALLDVLLVLVLALLLYAMSARSDGSGAGLFDRIQLALVACALAVDAFALVNIAVRLGEFGLSANRTAAIGLNLVLLVNLAWSLVLQTRFVRSRSGLEAVESWHMRYVPVYALWAAIVVVVFPPLFGFA